MLHGVGPCGSHPSHLKVSFPHFAIQAKEEPFPLLRTSPAIWPDLCLVGDEPNDFSN